MSLRSIKRIAFILIALMLLGVVGVRVLFFWQVKQAIIEQVETLRLAGTRATYVSLEVNPWNRSLYVTGISVRSNTPDSMCQSRFIVNQVAMEGIQMIPLVRSRKLVIESVVFRKPSIHLFNHPHSTDQKATEGSSVAGYEIRNLNIDSGHFELLKDGCQPTLAADVSLTFTDLYVEHPGSDSLLWHVSTAVAKEAQIVLPQDFYVIRVQSAGYSRNDQTLQMDSLSMESNLDRMKFVTQVRHQIDQITCHVPFMKLKGLQITQSLPPSISIAGADIAFAIEVFRDMRFPGVSSDPTELPIQVLKKFPLSLQIDSLTFSPSSVLYQELPESGGIPGRIFFDQIRGNIKNVSTDSVGESVMQVTSRFMDAGDLSARFTFPLEKNKPYTVQATLENFEMTSINEILIPLVNLQVSSGQMQALKFAFQYDDIESTGNLDLRYSNLKFKSLNANKERSTNPLSTLLINTMIQNRMDKTDSKQQRSGRIQWNRDPQSSLFSYWWKSIRSGIKSVFRLEKILGLESRQKEG